MASLTPRSSAFLSLAVGLLALLNTGAASPADRPKDHEARAFTPTRIDPRPRQLLNYVLVHRAFPPGYPAYEELVRDAVIPVVARFENAPDKLFAEALAAAGGGFGLSGLQASLSGAYSLRVSLKALELLEREKNLKHLELDLPRTMPTPMNRAQVETRAASLRRAVLAKNGTLVDGTGVTIADIDSGIMPLLPTMRRADGGLASWVDANANGVFDVGIDCVERNEVPGCQPEEALKLYEFDTRVFTDGPWGAYLQDTQDALSKPGVFEPDVDYVFVDANGNGKFDMGIGTDDSLDSLSEPIFVVDDVNQDGVLGASERLLRLGSSKVKKIYGERGVYGAGSSKSLLSYAKSLSPADAGTGVHGMGVAHELIAGVLGRSRLAGLVPGASLIEVETSARAGLVGTLQALAADKPDIVLTEYAPYIGYPLDGSSEEEVLLDALHDAGTVVIKPAGNLGTGERHWAGTVAGGTTSFKVVPYRGGDGTPGLQFGVVHREVSGGGVAPTVSVKLPDGTVLPITLNGENAQMAGYYMQGTSMVSTRGTRYLQLFVAQIDDAGNQSPLPLGEIRVDVTYPSGTPSLQAHAYVASFNSPWSGGLAFAERSTSAGTICHPSTSDKGLRIGAYTLRSTYSEEVQHQLAGYSSRGPLLFGPGTISITAPANPLVAAYEASGTGSPLEGESYSYFLFGGTSGSSPMVVGAAAMLRQLDPTASSTAVEAALTEHARKEPGVTDNVDAWGAGKLDVLAAAGMTAGGGSAPTVALRAASEAYLNEPLTLRATVQDDKPGVKLRWDTDYDGTWDTAFSDVALAGTQSVQSAEAGPRFVRVEALDSDGNLGGASTVLVFGEPRRIPPDGAVLGGGGVANCTAKPRGAGSGLFALVVALALGLFGVRTKHK